MNLALLSALIIIVILGFAELSLFPFFFLKELSFGNIEYLFLGYHANIIKLKAPKMLSFGKYSTS